jgi:hypothetical protein
MTNEAEQDKGARLSALIRAVSVPDGVRKMLNEATYTMSERNQWPDEVSGVSAEQALLCWQLVEWLRTQETFPADLRM